MSGQQASPTGHLPGCCRIDRHIVPLDCEVPNDDLKPIAPVRPSSQDEMPTKECEVCHRQVPINDWDYGVCNPCRILAGAIQEGDA